MKRVFISGPVTGLDYEKVVQDFNAAEQLLLNKGYQVMNPITFVPAGEEWIPAMRRCLVALSKCDVICFLPGFNTSEGSLFEFSIAHKLKMDVMFEDDGEILTL